MNSLSIITSRVDQAIGTTTRPTTPSTERPSLLALKRSSSESDVPTNTSNGNGGAGGAHNSYSTFPSTLIDGSSALEDTSSGEEGSSGLDTAMLDEKIGLLATGPSKRKGLFGTIVDKWIGAFRWIISTISIGIEWLVSFVYDERGYFSPFKPVVDVARFMWKPMLTRGKDAGEYEVLDEKAIIEEMHSESTDASMDDSAIRTSITNTRQPLPSEQQQPQQPRRSIRIRLRDESKSNHSKSPSTTSLTISNRITKYPRAPSPSRPLLPKNPSRKTLILDLDETLIHSLAKGGRMSSGHMVEVKLDRQHAILYYVHKRPFCDEFLRAVSKWYDLVVFTASVQEYADPVIDWLESERKYFSRRYYRQHCTLKQGAYVKDLEIVEGDLSKVIIVDNSPVSYIFHEGKLDVHRKMENTSANKVQIMQFQLKGGLMTRPISTY